MIATIDDDLFAIVVHARATWIVAKKMRFVCVVFDTDFALPAGGVFGGDTILVNADLRLTFSRLVVGAGRLREVAFVV